MRQEQDGTPSHIASQYLNCAECTVDPYSKRLWHCGWIPSSQWIDEPMRPFAEVGATVCPGYSTSLPVVIEASRLLSWRRDGELRSLLGERKDDDGSIAPLPAVASEAMDLLDVEAKGVEREMLRRSSEGSKPQ